jgi:hypothetical protein
MDSSPLLENGLVPAGKNLPSSLPSQFPEILVRAGKSAVFATEEFFFGRIRNEHTRAAYLIAIRRFLQWAEIRGLELRRIAPKDVGQYLDGLRNEKTSVATRKQYLAAIRHYFDGLVTRQSGLPELGSRSYSGPNRRISGRWVRSGERHATIEATASRRSRNSRRAGRSIGIADDAELALAFSNELLGLLWRQIVALVKLAL